MRAGKHCCGGRPRDIWHWSRETFRLPAGRGMAVTATESVGWEGSSTSFASGSTCPVWRWSTFRNWVAVACPSGPRPTGLLLDRISSEAGFYRVQTLARIVVGNSGAWAGWRRPKRCAERSPDWRPANGHRVGWVKHWATRLRGLSDIDRIRRLASSRAFPFRRAAAEPAGQNWTALRVAIAWDDAFHCYYPGDARIAGIARGNAVRFFAAR